MKHRTKKFLAISMALAVVAASAFLALASIIATRPQSASAAGISSITDYAVPGGDPWGTAFDSSGRVWVAVPGCDLAPSCPNMTPPGKLALFDPTSHSWVTTVSLPTGYGQPTFVAVDHTGKVWFTMPVTNAIGMYDPTSTAVSQWPVPTTSAGPWGIAVDPAGTIWFTEHYVNKISSFNPSSHTFHEIATPATNSQPYGITTDASGNIWFTENIDAVALIGEYTTDGILKEYKIRNTATGGTGLTPHLITIDPDGNPWWSEGFVGSLGSFPIGGGSFSLTKSPGDHPHDGLNVDSQNSVWFDEEFANKLGEAIPSSATPTPTATVAPGTTLGTDTFQRANQSHWGTASGGQTWGADANNQSVFSISGNTGHVTNTGATSYSAVLGSSTSDAEVSATGSLSSFSSSNFGDVLRWTDGNNWYKGYIDGSNLTIQKRVNGTSTTLITRPLSATAGTSYTIHFRVVGSTLTANAWASSGSEPAGWMVTASDSSLTSGFSGMRFLTQAGTATITSFLADVPGGSGTPTNTPTPTPTNTPTPTPTSTPTPTPTATPGTTLGTDTFQRANRSHWGTASDGQTWGGDANIQSIFSISGNTGLVSNTGSASYSAALGSSSSNAEVYATGSLSSFSSSNFGDVLRWTDGNNWYKAYIDGSNLIIQKKVSGTSTTLISMPFSATAGTSYTIHFRVVGTTLTANAWASSGSEPAGWMATASDSTFTSGFSGMRFLTQAGTATVTSFLAKSL